MNSIELLEAVEQSAGEHAPSVALRLDVRWAKGTRSVAVVPAGLDGRIRFRLTPYGSHLASFFHETAASGLTPRW